MSDYDDEDDDGGPNAQVDHAREIKFVAPPTLARFLRSNAFVRVAVGPVGSGKSSACIVEIMRRAREQAAGPDNVRRTRFAIIRNTYRELKDTTRRTFEQWIPRAAGTWREQDFTFRMRLKLDDGSSVDSEILFRALDRPEDAKKLLSLELTGAYLNELREIPKSIFDMLKTRVGRFPSRREGGCKWSGIWADTNPWHSQHWGAGIFKQNLKGHELFRQPGGRSSEAENIENLHPEYYERLIAGMDREWVKVHVDGEDAAAVVGSIFGDLIAEHGEPGVFEYGKEEMFTSWDLGRSDSTAIWFWQLNGDTVSLVDFYENHLHPLSHYMDVVEKRGYHYIRHFLPHDARARTLASEVSVEDQMRDRFHGRVEIGPNLALQDGIAAARWLLEAGRCRFHARTKAGMEALAAYRREWDPESRAYSTRPLHDWSSHASDAFRYCACVVKTSRLLKPKMADTPVKIAEGITLEGLYEARAEELRSRRDRV